MKQLLFLILLYPFAMFAQAPDNYYASTQGEKGMDLKTALHFIIRNHQSLRYGDLWNAYKTTDDHYNDDKTEIIVWDMYSDNPTGKELEFTFQQKQCGTYRKEGDCYNREHSFPKSWWGGSKSTPMYTDMFHVIPTDGYVNSIRGNWPIGEVKRGSEKYISKNGSKLGRSAVKIPNYSGYVFEPIDAYKGDIARNYFYMATRYEDKIANWENNTPNSDIVLNGNDTTVYENWLLQLLLKWHRNDPPSQKEIDRNNDIYSKFQGNRNPFIDHPEFVECIWANDCSKNSSTPINAKYVAILPLNHHQIEIINKKNQYILIEILKNGKSVYFCHTINTEIFDLQLYGKGNYTVEVLTEGGQENTQKFKVR